MFTGFAPKIQRAERKLYVQMLTRRPCQNGRAGTSSAGES